jgi:acyl carrier protein
MDAMELIKTAVLAVDTTKKGKLDGITPKTEIRELGMDSVATMEMVGYLEEKLNTQFSDEVMVQIQTFGDLVDLIEKSRSGS